MTRAKFGVTLVLFGLSVLTVAMCMASLGTVVTTKVGDLYIAEKVDVGDFWKVRGSLCGHCGSDFLGWLYLPKSFDVVELQWYKVRVYNNMILEVLNENGQG